MPAFHYHAVDKTGRAHRGVLEASTAAAARRALRERSMLPVSVHHSSSGRTSAADDSTRKPVRTRRLGAQSIALVTRQLATLVGNNVPVEEALRTVAKQAGSVQVASRVWSLHAAVSEGRSLSTALAEAGSSFPEYYRAAVAAGEQSGKLGGVLGHLADFVEAQKGTRQKVQLALLYPALLGVVSLAMITLLLIYVVPDIVRVFVSRGVELPMLTQGLIGLSEFLNRWGLAIAAAFLSAAFLSWRWLQSDANRITAHRRVATAPLIGVMSRKLNAARFSGTLATLVQSGVPLVEAMRAAAAATPNRHVRNRVNMAIERVKEGASLRQAIEDAGCFPPMLIAMVAAGESSGKLGSSLERASEDQQRDLTSLTATVVALVEPAVLLIMGGVVLLLVLAILLPIVNLNNLAGR